MKRLLITIALCLLAGSAGAEQITPLPEGQYTKQWQEGLTFRCNQAGKCFPVSQDDPCLATMEQAMRAMEPFLLHNFMFVPDDKQLQAPLGAYGPAIKESRERSKQWQAAKACWRDK